VVGKSKSDAGGLG
jgi:hypothetical protein